MHPELNWSGAADAAPLRIKLNISYSGGFCTFCTNWGSADSAGAYSTDVAYTLTTGENSAVLTVTANAVGYEYDTSNNLSALVETIGGTELWTSYTYDKDNRPTSVTTVTTQGDTTTSVTEEYTYDSYGRISQKVTKNGDTVILTETYTYVEPTPGAYSTQVASAAVTMGVTTTTYTYTYDDNGNILSVGEYVVVEKVQHEILESSVTVYNFQVEGFHTYYVSSGVLVHNKCDGETPATKRGRHMHQDWDYGPAVQKEQTIAPGARVDGIDRVNGIVYELKPNNPQAIRRGLNQLDRYLRIFGEEDWAGVLVLYD